LPANKRFIFSAFVLISNKESLLPPGGFCDSAFHRAELAQGDQGINPGQQKMRPVIFPALPEGP
jgi:hypothetical protein